MKSLLPMFVLAGLMIAPAALEAQPEATPATPQEASAKQEAKPSVGRVTVRKGGSTVFRNLPSPYAEKEPFLVVDTAIAAVEPLKGTQFRVKGLKEGKTNVEVKLESGEDFTLVVSVVEEEKAESSKTFNFHMEWEQDLRRDGSPFTLRYNQRSDSITVEGSYLKGEESETQLMQFLESAKAESILVRNRTREGVRKEALARNLQVTTELLMLEAGDMKNLGFQYDGVRWGASASGQQGGGVSNSNGQQNTQTSNSAVVALNASTRGNINFQEGKNNAKRLDLQTITTTDGKQAMKQYGGTILRQNTTANSSTTDRIEFGNILKVTPKLVGKNDAGVEQVEVALEIESSLPGPDGNLTKNSATTNIIIPTNTPCAVANVLADYRSKNFQNVPGMAKVPLIGELFKNRNFQNGSVEAIFIITVNTEAPMQKGQDIVIPEELKELTRERERRQSGEAAPQKK